MDATVLISISISLALLLALGSVCILWLSRARSRELRTRILGGTRAVPGPETESPAARIKSRLIHALESIGQAVKPKDEKQLSDLRTRLILAGYRSSGASIVFWGIRVILAVSLPLAVFLVPHTKIVQGLSTTHMLLLAVFLALVGSAAPSAWVDAKTRKRQQKVLEQFPDALDLLVVCVEAGLGLDAAINRVGADLQSVHPELSEELRLFSAELRAGYSREEALRNLARRTALQEIQSLTALLIQTDRYGTSIAQALRTHADSMRKKRQFRAEELAAKLPVKMLFPLVLFIFPNLFLVALGPAVINLLRMMRP